tara:strand:- start:380 stop:553 length:174 start_codon:yes stop_codon:yes gene_type:complete
LDLQLAAILEKESLRLADELNSALVRWSKYSGGKDDAKQLRMQLSRWLKKKRQKHSK